MSRTKSNSKPRVSVIVPVAPDEPQLERFLTELEKLPEDFEIILAGKRKATKMGKGVVFASVSKDGRAAALNAGAARAGSDWLWFLHADSRLETAAVDALGGAIASEDVALYYFKLVYHDGKWFHRINEIGANIRSQLFFAPFGDQSFCMPRRLFEMLGGYREDASYGEDLLLARAASRAKVPLVMLPASVGTSSRHHQQNGWLRVMVKYQWLWISLALADRGAS